MNVYVLNKNFTSYDGEEREIPSYKIGILGLMKLRRMGVPFTRSSEKADEWAFKKFNDDGIPLMIRKRNKPVGRVRLSDIADEYSDNDSKQEKHEKNEFKENLIVSNTDNMGNKPSAPEEKREVSLTKDEEEIR